MGGLVFSRDGRHFLAAVSVGQQLPQAGFVLVFLGLLPVLRALYRRRRSQHGARSGLHRAGGTELLEFFLFRHKSYLTTEGDERTAAK
jgi:hypothetical protein